MTVPGSAYGRARRLATDEEARRRRLIEERVTSVFEGWGYEEIIPPLFDYADVFAGEALAPVGGGFEGGDDGGHGRAPRGWRDA